MMAEYAHCITNSRFRRNFWSTSFDDVRALQCNTATLNIISSCNRLMECLIKRFFPQPSTAHDDGLFISKPCFEEVHILEHTTCLHQRWKNERSLHRRKRHIGPSDAVFVAYELPITELKIQRIVRACERFTSPLAHFTNKIVPQVSWEIALHTARRKSVFEITNFSSSPMFFFCLGTMCPRAFCTMRRFVVPVAG